MEESIVIVRSCVVLVAPGNQVECETPLLEHLGNCIKSLPRVHCMLKNSKAKCNIEPANIGLGTIVDVTNNGIAQFLGGGIRIKDTIL